MAGKKNDAWSNLRLDGILAWVHRLVMFITFPLRCFWLFAAICLAIFAILLIIPLYNGVPLGKISAWYGTILPFNSLADIKDKALANASVKFEAVEDKMAEISAKVTGKNIGYAQTSENEKVKLVAWPVADFKRSQYRPKAATVSKQSSEVASAKKRLPAEADSFKALKEPPMRSVLSGNARKVESKRQQTLQNRQQTVVPEHTLFYSGELTDYYERLEGRGLVYADKPEVLYGRAEVNGPNAMSIGGRFFFLYGIYTDGRKYDVMAAEQYLRNVTADAPIYCAVVAYSAKNQVPTALCFVNGIFVNRSMVNHNLAENVGLK